MREPIGEVKTGAIAIGRPVDGIAINGNEFVFDANQEFKKFESKETAFAFIRAEIFPDASDAEINDYFVFCDHEKLQNGITEYV